MSTTLNFDPWHFLTTPLEDLLSQCRVRGIMPADGADGFLAAVEVITNERIDVHVAPCDSETERETVLRGILAAWFGVDTTDWPVAMQLTSKARQ